MPINQPILQNELADSNLLEKGYVTLPFLNKTEVQILREFFFDHHQELPPGLFATAHSSDIEFRNKMSDKIKAVFERAIQKYFVSYQALGGTFITKSKGGEGLLYPHQDWNIVDENEFRSFNVWVPLVDVDESNGSIQVLPKSHKMGSTYRGVNIDSAFADIVEESWTKMQTLKMEAGQALVYDHSLLHASKANETEEPRLVVVFGIIPEGAEMRYYYKNDNIIEEYSCTASFFLKENPSLGPKGLKKTREISDGFVSFTKRDLEKLNKNKFWFRWDFWRK